MSTNDEPEVTETPVEEPSTSDLEQELRDAKAADKPAAEETAPEDKPSETVEAEEKSEATLTTEKPSEPEKDLDWYKKAYAESTKEALRLKTELDTKPAAEAPVAPALSATDLYVQQKQNEEIKTAFDDISTKYPDVLQQDTYKKFTAQANVLGRVIYESENRVPAPKELYEKTVVVMGLQPDTSEQVASAMKDSAGTARTASVPSNAPQSKVSEDVIALNLKMYPNKTRQDIIEELEPHIN